MMSASVRPASGEYAQYYEGYISSVPAGDIIKTLQLQMTETLDLLGRIPEERGGFRYDKGKWSIKEVLGHVIDGERIFAYRTLRFARNDQLELQGFEQDDYVASSNSDRRTIAELAREFEHVRLATIDLLGSLDEESWSRTGVANQNRVSVRALAYIIAGHERHHVEVLKTRYLV
ncbi:MAG TPA: DinB family protein [Blastocatellia bacterium]|nr:DinB family protein [Blastocatellia bacterium]